MFVMMPTPWLLNAVELAGVPGPMGKKPLGINGRISSIRPFHKVWVQKQHKCLPRPNWPHHSMSDSAMMRQSSRVGGKDITERYQHGKCAMSPLRIEVFLMPRRADTNEPTTQATRSDREGASTSVSSPASFDWAASDGEIPSSGKRTA
jgi:hypothetical protein